MILVAVSALRVVYAVDNAQILFDFDLTVGVKWSERFNAQGIGYRPVVRITPLNPTPTVLGS